MDKFLEKFNLLKLIQKKLNVWLILVLWKKLKEQAPYNQVILFMGQYPRDIYTNVDGSNVWVIKTWNI